MLSSSELYARGAIDSTVVVAARIERPPKLDSIFTDSIWNLAAPITHLTQRELHEGAPATESTQVRIAYDDRAIYVGV
ncbi:MAG TPA: hypothetical protein VES59_11050, partial [Bacteroidota bacterium]|nr:hypothetical protein [Bacteroidota bacterium]